MNIECKFSHDFFLRGRCYCCIIEEQEIPANKPIKFSEKHEYGYQNKDVKELLFFECSMLNIPQGLAITFQNVKGLTITDSHLKNIKKQDIADFKLLDRINISDNLIEFLPGDLFEDSKNLKEISFHSNKLKIIEPNILDGLHDLKLVNISDNPNYQTYYSVDEPDTTLEQVKNELTKVFLENSESYKEMQKDFEGKKQKKSKKNRKKHSKKQKGISSDLENLIKDEKFKDFKIQVCDREFHVHKFLLIARSPTIAEILLNNPGAENLNLVDISVDIFETILKFLYTDELPPVENLNDLRLFAAAGRLKIEELKNFAATHAMNQIDGDNALEVLKLSNKYEHVQLRQKAFHEIKKGYPKIMFKDKWAMKPEFVENIIEKFKKMKEMEEMVKTLKEEFDKELLND